MSTPDKRRASIAKCGTAGTIAPPVRKRGLFARLIEAHEAAAIRHVEHYLAAQSDERLKTGFGMTDEDIKALRAGDFRLLWR